MPDKPSKPDQPARFTLERLSSAFARLMGSSSTTGAKRPQIAVDADDRDLADQDRPLPVTPRMIVEGLLFVGHDDGRPFSARELAAPIRNVEPAEVESLIAELNDAYRRDGSPYEIVAEAGGFRLQLSSAAAEVRQKLRGQTRAAKLTPAALEVLAVVAYRQPITAEEINKLRRGRCQAILSQLVQRQLVRLDRPEPQKTPVYQTTDRFNQLFGVKSAAELPRAEDLEDA
jgi:segregation and condensation protein B